VSTVHNRRDFIRTTALGVTAAALSSRVMRGAPPVLAAENPAPPVAESSATLMERLVTAEQRGVVYLHDSLNLAAAAPAKLLVRTELADPAQCGLRRRG
jgi:hypothetical protein